MDEELRRRLIEESRAASPPAEWLPDEPGEVVPPTLLFTVNKQTGDLLDIRVDPAWTLLRRATQRAREPAAPQQRSAPRPRERRSQATRRGPPSGDDDPEPEPPLGGSDLERLGETGAFRAECERLTRIGNKLIEEARGEAQRRARTRPGEDLDSRTWRAMMLALDVETCSALLGGESVPIEKLDPEWVRRFGRRSA